MRDQCRGKVPDGSQEDTIHPADSAIKREKGEKNLKWVYLGLKGKRGGPTEVKKGRGKISQNG